MRRVFFLIVGTVMFITACQTNSDKVSKSVSVASETKCRVKLRWLAQWYGEGQKEQLIREITREFSFLNQDIDLEMEFSYQMFNLDPGQNTFAKMIDSVAQMVRLNQWPYDIMLCDADIYANVGNRLGNPDWGREYLVNFLDEPWFVNSHKNGMFTTTRYTEKYGGIAPGAYIEGLWKLFYVSSVVEQKLGIQVKTYDMNTDDLISYAQAVSNYNATHTDKVTLMEFPYGATPFFYQLLMSSLAKDKANSDDEALAVFREVYESLEKLSHYKDGDWVYLMKDPFNLDEKNILMTFHYTWVTPFWQKFNPEGYQLVRPVELPGIKNKVATCYSGIYSSVFVVPKNAAHREEAIKLMKFIASAETAEKWTKYAKAPTGLKAQIAYNDLGTDDFSRLNQHIEQKYHGILDDVNVGKVFFGTSKQFDYQFEKVLNGEISADAALQSLKRQISNR